MAERVGERAFVDRVRELTAAEFRRFVADVYRERDGYVVVDGSGEPVDRNGEPADWSRAVEGATRVYVGGPGDPSIPATGDGTDVVVTRFPVGVGSREPPESVQVVGPAELYRTVRYALDAEVGDGICSRHLGVVAGGGAATVGGSTSEGGTDPAPADGVSPGTGRGGPEPPGTLSRPRAVLLALAVLAVGVGAGFGFGVAAGPTAPPGDTTTAGTTGGAVGAAGGPASGTATGTPVTNRVSPPESDRQATDDRYGSLAPNCRRPAGLVVALWVDAVGTGEDTVGPRAAYRFLTPETQRAVGSVDGFVSILRSETYDELLSGGEVRYGPTETDDRTASRTVTVVGAANDSTAYRFRLRQVGTGENSGCWMVDRVLRLESGTATGAGSG
jgi:hypothetical protein